MESGSPKLCGLFRSNEFRPQFFYDIPWSDERPRRVDSFDWSGGSSSSPSEGNLEAIYSYGVDWQKDELFRSPLHQWMVSITPNPSLRLLRVKRWYDSRPTMLTFHMALRSLRSLETVWQPHDVEICLSHRLINQKIGFQLAWFQIYQYNGIQLSKSPSTFIRSRDDHVEVNRQINHSLILPLEFSKGWKFSVLREFDDDFMAGFEIIWSADNENKRHYPVIPFPTLSKYHIRLGGRYRLADTYVFGVEIDQLGAFRSSYSFLWKNSPFRGCFTLGAFNGPPLQDGYRQNGCSIAYEDRIEMSELEHVQQTIRNWIRARWKLPSSWYSRISSSFEFWKQLRISCPSWWHTSWFNYRVELTGSGICSTMVEWRIPAKHIIFGWENRINLRDQNCTLGVLIAMD